jgi:hypothetical protein
MRLFKFTSLAIAILLFVGCSTTNLTIRWSEESSQFVTRGGYARIKKVDNHHALVYGAGRSVWIRFSDDECESWSSPVEVARGEGYNYTNSELLQLQSGKLLFMWNARPLPNTGLPFKIMYALSDDGGRSWSRGHDLYIAGTKFRDGCWEPAALQLPNGEIHIYFANEAPYTSSSEQEITLMRSFDEGKTWGQERCCMDPAEGYFILNNDRVIRLQSGRILFAMGTRARAPFQKYGETTTFIASEGQFFSHFLHPIQAFEHFCLAVAPFSLLLHVTSTFCLSSISPIILCGQVLTHIPHPIHFLVSMCAIPFLRHIAPCGQTFAQSPSPIQPKLHFPFPPYMVFAASQLCIPT